MPYITQHFGGSTERSGNFPNITQLISGSTERLGTLPNSTQLKNGNTERLGITSLPRSKHLLISWLQSTSAVILEPRKIKSDTVSPSISHEVMGPDAMILVF